VASEVSNPVKINGVRHDIRHYRLVSADLLPEPTRELIVSDPVFSFRKLPCRNSLRWQYSVAIRTGEVVKGFTQMITAMLYSHALFSSASHNRRTRRETEFVSGAMPNHSIERTRPGIALRRFRDETLQLSPLGRMFIAIYYRVSPPVAKFLSSKPLLAAAVRKVLNTMARYQG
jgi:hypothetical protein